MPSGPSALAGATSASDSSSGHPPAATTTRSTSPRQSRCSSRCLRLALGQPPLVLRPVLRRPPGAGSSDLAGEGGRRA
eukprot:5820845-Alexandrium_andersonii.AAC.1